MLSEAQVSGKLSLNAHYTCRCFNGAFGVTRHPARISMRPRHRRKICCEAGRLYRATEFSCHLINSIQITAGHPIHINSRLNFPGGDTLIKLGSSELSVSKIGLGTLQVSSS